MPDLWSEGNSSLSVYLPLKSYEKIVGRVLRPRHGMPDLRHFDVTNSFPRHLADRLGPVGLASNIHCSSGCSGYAAATNLLFNIWVNPCCALWYITSMSCLILGLISVWSCANTDHDTRLTCVKHWHPAATSHYYCHHRSLDTHCKSYLVFSAKSSYIIAECLETQGVPHWFTQSEWMVGNLWKYQWKTCVLECGQCNSYKVTA